MESLIIYDAASNSTAQAAAAIALGLVGRVRVVAVSDEPLRYVQACTILIVGSPSRRGACTPAMLQFLQSINADHIVGKPVAVFDTRVRGRGLRGTKSASRQIARELRQLGGDLYVPPEGFNVTGAAEWLLPGELDRAREWGAALSKQLEPMAAQALWN